MYHNNIRGREGGWERLNKETSNTQTPLSFSLCEQLTTSVDEIISPIPTSSKKVSLNLLKFDSNYF